jgi:hypothetical protein
MRLLLFIVILVAAPRDHDEIAGVSLVSSRIRVFTLFTVMNACTHAG